MKLCPTCQNKYPDDANFCPREECAGAQGPQRLVPVAEPPPARFVPVSRIGGGQSGEVWQASDAQSGAAVALKIVATEVLPTPVAAERMQRELRQLQRANSPRIVKVIDFGKDGEGRLFIASELSDGEPLDQVVARSGPFSLERAKRVLGQIGEALLEAQKVGVVHRDLSAKNVLVSADDQARVINFAVPRPLLEGLFGVPGYLSPEQADGKLIDQRSNTYSLGALLYLMLTGQPPHTGATAKEIVDATIKGEIAPPSIKRGGGLGAEVDRIVLKALEKSSSRRPLTMRQFLTDVAGLLAKDDAAPSTAAAAAPAAAPAGRDVGFARTMMYSGAATDVHKLIAQAVAARQAAGNGAPAPAPVHAPAPAGDAGGASAAPAPAGSTPSPAKVGTPAPAGMERAGTPLPIPSGTGAAAAKAGQTPPPTSRPVHGAAVAATMIAMPASTGPASASPIKVDATPSLPPSGARTPPLDPSRPTADASGNFRETLWFKKGDVDQMVADARAKAAAIAEAKKVAASAEAEPPIAELAAGEEAKPLEDRYVDDGTVTVEDREKFSLGSASNKVAARAATVPGERMSESEMIDEIGGGKRLVIIGIVAAVVVALVAVIAVSSSRKSSQEKARAAEAAAAAVASPPPASPSVPAPVPQAATPEPPAATAPPDPDKSTESADAAKTIPARKKAPPHKKPVPVKKRR
jgi:eukaryotic-like serine/threonine-protein kinase